MEDGPAYCDTCGWVGLASELLNAIEHPLANYCPKCARDSTWWGPPDLDILLTIGNDDALY
jgi:hypothetical protein